jgi:hypothetical protein
MVIKYRGLVISLDFTLKKYSELCSAINDSNFPVIRMVDYFKNTDKKNLNTFIILRHDVDKLPENALAMAQLEDSLNIRSTYYFRITPESFDPQIIGTISGLGHEIGYHYEDLSRAKGDLEKAKELFEEALTSFRNITEISTICRHGSPTSKWNNSDLWKKYEFKDYGIIGEPYLSINYSDIVYFTDTGRTWCDKGSVRDHVKDSVSCKEMVSTTDELIVLIKSKKYKKLIILAHPQRWALRSSKWLKELVAQNIKNIGKDLILRKRVKSGE